MNQPKVSRRFFLNSSAAAAGAFAMPAILRSQGGQSPNNKLNVACVGVGGRGDAAVAGMKDENRVAFCDVDTARAAKNLAAFPDVPRFRDYREMLDKLGNRIDAITVSTTDFMHYPIAVAALSLGKHVFVEKPLTHTIWEARQLAKLAAEKKVATQMGNQGHANEGPRLLKEWVQAGVLGEVRELHTWTDRPGAAMVTFQFPARGSMPPLKWTWYENGLMPPTPPEIEQGRQLPGNGTLIVGSKATALTDTYYQSVRIIPEAKMLELAPTLPPKQPMNRHLSPGRFWYSLKYSVVSVAVICTVMGAPALFGQSVPTPAEISKVSPVTTDEAAIELSPFTITADKDTGWTATQTLAGSRLRTNLGDLAQPLEVMTSSFLNDLAVNNFEQALEYATNIAGPNEYSDNSNNMGTGFGNTQPKNNNIVRGLGGATMSVDFFESSMPSDNYNAQRLTIARGPNTLLFGMGNPSGVVDTTLNRGDLQKNIASVRLQMNSDSSKRGSFDINRVVLRDKLALRLDGMTDEGIQHIKPNLDRQTRLYGAITARPFQKTTITVGYEHTFWNSSRARTQLPVDEYTPWLRAASLAGSPYTTNQPLYNNGGIAALPSLSNNPVFTGASTNSQIVATYGGFGAIANGDVRSWGHTVATRGPDSIPTALNPLNSFDQFTQGLYGATNPVPHNVNVFGLTQFIRQTSDDWRVNLDQEVLKNLFVQGSWFHQGYFSEDAAAGFAGLVYMDANMYLPDGATPNPNVGRFYTQGGGQANGNHVSEEKRDDYRVTLTYDLDLRNKAGWVGKWLLGHLRPVAMFEQDNFRGRNQQYNRSVLDTPVLPGVTASAFTIGSVGTGATGTGTRNWASNANRALTTRFYLGGPAGNAPGNPYADLYAPVWNFADANGKPYGAYTSRTPWTSPEGYPLISGAVPGGSLQKTNTMQFALQDYILNDRVVLLYGWRHDSSKSASIDPKYQTTDWSGLNTSYKVATFGPWGSTQAGNTETKGIVFHLTPWLSGLYNRSKTFQPNIGKYDPFGNEYSGSTGKADDYGVELKILHDSLHLRVTHYQNTAGPIRAGNTPFQDPIRDNLYNIDQNIMQLDPSMTQLNAGRSGYRDLGRANYWVMLDNRSTGNELALTWRPSKNWDFIVNGSKTTTVQSNIGKPWFDWINARLPVWQAASTTVNGAKVNVWNTQPYNLTPGAQTFAQYFKSTIQDQQLATFAAYDGTSVDQGRQYSGNFISAYRFTEGRLKGLSTNLAFRYRAGATIGYATTTGSGGTLLLDPTQPIKGPATLLTDLGVSYGGKIAAFQNIRYRIQLNVRNLFNEWTLVPVKAMTTGQFGRWQLLPPRTYVVSCTFDF